MSVQTEWKRGDVHPMAHDAFEQGLIDRAADWDETGASQRVIAADEATLRIEWNDVAVNVCESPIEQILLAHMLFAGYGYEKYFPRTWQADWPFPKPNNDILISPQHQVGDYRVDFLLIAKDFSGDELQVVIECDGHDFHERTKEQAKRDRSRDRQLQVLGYKVFRFTGSEIWNDCAACIEDIRNVVAAFVEVDLIARGIIAGRGKRHDA